MIAAPQTNERPTWVAILIVPVVIGAVTGIVVGLVADVVEGWFLDSVVLGIPGIWFALPSIGVFLLTRLALTKVAGATSPSTADLFPALYHDPSRPYPLRQVPGRLLSGFTTVGLGGSQGLESQSVMLGSSLGMMLRRLLGKRLPYLDTDEGHRLILVSGAAAGIATVFSSPILGAAYGIEMPFRRTLDGRRLVPAFLAAAASFGTASLIGSTRNFINYQPHPISVKELIGVLIVAVLCGVGARIFAAIMNKTRDWKNGNRPWLRATGAGFLLCAIAMCAWLVTGEAVTAGPGYVASAWAIPAEAASPAVLLVVAALIFRCITVLLCVAAGGGGGVFTSMATNGLLIGTAVALLLGLPDVTLLALVGAGAFLGAGYRIPLAGAGLIVEISGAALPAALGIAAVAIAMVIMGSGSASDAQADPPYPALPD